MAHLLASTLLLLATCNALAQQPAPPPPKASAGSDATNWRHIATQAGTEADIERRYGPAASEAPSKGLPTYRKRPDQSYKPISVRLKFGDRNCVDYCGSWSIGGPLTAEPGDFSSSIVNVAYVPDGTPGAGFHAKRYFGVAALQTINIAHNAMSVKPEPSWTTWEGAGRDGGNNGPNMERYAGVAEGLSPWLPRGIRLDRPVALGKCYGRGGWCTNQLIAYASGWIVSEGSNTAHTMLAVKLPDEMVPMAITVTNSGEFALVAVMNTATQKAQMAVVALADGCQWCDPRDEAKWYANWGSHRRTYMGLPGLGNFIAAKYIGAVDLPDGLRVPTEISATTGKRVEDYERVRNFWNDDVGNGAIRARYEDPEDLGVSIARTGLAVVISKSERKAAVVDLRPLFEFYWRAYFKSTPQQFDAMMDRRGDSDEQWPPRFAQAPDQRPRVISTIDLPQAPTAVRLTLQAPYRALIATQEGRLRVFDLGTRYLDQKAAQTGAPGDIKPMFTVEVGRNPTSLAYVRDHGWADKSRLFAPATSHQMFIVNARQDRKIQWVQFDRGFTSARIFKTLQDSRLVDPIAVEDVANHGTESYVVTVADYGAKAVRNYLYGPIIWWTYGADSACPKPRGCALLDNAPFEYGGDWPLPGKPFQLGGANIN